jgi:hypothetical protein
VFARHMLDLAATYHRAAEEPKEKREEKSAPYKAENMAKIKTTPDDGKAI